MSHAGVQGLSPSAKLALSACASGVFQKVVVDPVTGGLDSPPGSQQRRQLTKADAYDYLSGMVDLPDYSDWAAEAARFGCTDQEDWKASLVHGLQELVAAAAHVEEAMMGPFCAASSHIKGRFVMQKWSWLTSYSPEGYQNGEFTGEVGFVICLTV